MIAETEERHTRTRPSLAVPLGWGCVLLVGAGVLLGWAGRRPPGLLDSEAAQGLLAREAAANGLALVRDGGAHSPALAALIALTARATGFDAATPRQGAALAGIATLLFSMLWLRRLVGPGWAGAGGALLAGSCWFLLYSGVALSPIAGAMMLAALLWLLAEAHRRERPASLAWYALAGVAAGLGVVADPALRVVPALLLVALAAAAWQARRERGSTDPGGLLLTLAVGISLAAPFVRGALDDPARLAGWDGAPASWAAFGRDSGLSLARLVWYGAADPALNLPGDPLLGLLVVPWALLGLVVALRRARGPRALVAAGWGVLLLLPAALDGSDHPGRLLTFLPLLALLPVAGMRAAVTRWRGTARLAAVALVGLTLAGNGAWGGWRVAGWARDPATADAFHAGLTAALEAIDGMPPDQPVLLSTVGHGETVRYLAEGRDGLVTFDGRRVLPLPARGAATLVIPRETPVDPALLVILGDVPPLQVEPGRGEDGAREVYRSYAVDDRARARLPLSVPTTPFPGGLVFSGYRMTVRDDDTVAVVLAWFVPAGTPERAVRLRLARDDGSGASTAEITLPAVGADDAAYVLCLATPRLPDTTDPLGLSLALLDAAGRPVQTPGVDTDGYLLLDRFRFER